MPLQFVKDGINPFTRQRFDLFNSDAFAMHRPSHRRALVLTSASSLDARGSHVGGAPLLPRDMAWPTANGEPLHFLAQVALRDDQLLELAGPAGVLAVFASARDDFNPETDGVHAVFTRDDAPSRAVAPPREALGGIAVPLIATLTTEEEGTGYCERAHKVGGFANWIQGDARMHAFFASSLAGDDPEVASALHRLGIDPGTLRDNNAAVHAVRALEAAGIDPRILGRASTDFELLLRLDTDERAGLHWGDTGRFYLFARDSDVRARRFDRVVGTSDSY